MRADRFDALARMLARPTSRRVALVGGLAAAVVGLGAGGGRRLVMAQDAASPAASPAGSPFASPIASPLASPGPLDLLAGTPAAEGALLGRDGGTCKERLEPCSGSTDGWEECCSRVCAFSFRRNVYECT